MLAQNLQLLHLILWIHISEGIVKSRPSIFEVMIDLLHRT